MPQAATLRSWTAAVAVVWAAVMLGIAMAGETPVGTIEGRVMGSDTGIPIAGAQVWLQATGVVSSSDLQWRDTVTKSDGTFRFANVPAGGYKIEVQCRVHYMPPTAVEVVEGRTQELALELQPRDPYLHLRIRQKAFTSAEKPEIALDGFTRGSEVAIMLHSVDVERLLSPEGGSLRDALTEGYGLERDVAVAQRHLIRSTRVRSVTITKRDSEGVYYQRVSFPPLPPGVYLISADAHGRRDVGWITVSDIGLVTKESGLDILAYVVRRDTGAPVPGAAITVIEGQRTAYRGITDADGLWVSRVTGGLEAAPFRLIAAKKGASTAFLGSRSYEPVASPTAIYAYTDRPIYRPGQKVHFKGIARRIVGDSYRVPAGGQADVEVLDRRSSLIYRKSLPLNRFGSFSDSFDLPAYAPTGDYSLNCCIAGETGAATFAVAEYRKPEFSVTVEMPKKRCVRGERVKARIRAAYYFGAPVVGARVRWSVSQSDYWFWPEDEEFGGDFYSDDYEPYGTTVLEGIATTDEDGTAEVEFAARWKTSEDGWAAADQRFTVSAAVTDPSRREAEGEGSIIATQGDLVLSVEPEQYVAAVGEASRVRILVTDYDRKPRSGIAVNVTAEEVRWEAGERGEYEERYVRVARGEVRTDQAGKAAFSFKPAKPGSYVVRAECRDDGGRSITSRNWIWAPGAGDFGGYKYPDLEIVLDKKTYNPGDTAKVLINSREQGATALLTVEGRRLFDYKLVKLTSRTTVTQIPIKAAYRPNFYVSVCFVKDKDFTSQRAQARVSLREKTIRLTIAPDKRVYRPGDQATYVVKAVDAKGQPVRAEVSLGVADEAVYAIREDQTTPIRDFFYARQYDAVRTHCDFAEVYLSGDKAGYTGDIRKRFLDTAYWRADIVTDGSGQAQVSFKMPDNLTTWRATARAATMDTAVGQTISKVRVSKELLVRLNTPRFLVQKDEAVISAIVHNYTRESQKVRVGLQSPRLEAGDRLVQWTRVRSQGTSRVEWRVRAREPGSVTVMAFADCPAGKDAMQLDLPVRPYGEKRLETRTGSVSGSAVSERLVVRSDAIAGAGSIRIRLAPSLASALLGSLDYLASYPYGCTEQTMSAFLPDVVIWRTLKSLRLSNPDLEKKLPVMVGQGLNRLYDSQREDGGWGWCQYGPPDLWMTSYVLFGLLTARAAGFDVNRDVTENGLRSLEQQIARQRGATDGLFFGLYVLSQAGRGGFVRGRLADLLSKPLNDPRDLALVAMTLRNVGEPQGADYYLSKLWASASAAPGEIHWSGQGWAYYGVQPTETTALALMAISMASPDDQRIPAIVRWLMRQRQFNHWYSTRDTAMVLYALSGYLARSGELQPDFTAVVAQDGRGIGSYRFDRSTVFAPEKEIVIASDRIRKGDNVIRIEKTGPGVLYYTIEMEQFVRLPDSKVTLTGSGITISREYRKLVPRWDERSRSSRLEPSSFCSADFRSGEVVRVRLIVNSQRDQLYVIVEDYLPAGFEAFDRGRMEPWEWTYWWADKDVRDERVTFYARTLHKGKNVLEYEMRATTPGAYGALPPMVQAMYQPEVFAAGMQARIRVK